MKKILILFWVHSITLAQTDSSSKFSFSGFGDFYYSTDFQDFKKSEKEAFIYNHKRMNELSINLLVAKMNYQDTSFRGNFALMFGNYSYYNLSSEPDWARNLYEANIGLRLSRKHNLWLDAGTMPSHIGFESANNLDCWTLTRSLLAENSPYYETGIKISYTNSQNKLQASLLLLNGWQKIVRPEWLTFPNFGIQLNYKISPTLTFNYSNFLGQGKQDSLRMYHNFYIIYEFEKIGLVAGYDIGMDKPNKGRFDYWFCPIFILKFNINQRNKLALRIERVDDRKNLVFRENFSESFHLSAYSLNYDFEIRKNIFFRTELKYLDRAWSENSRFQWTNSLGFRFN